MDNNSFDDKLNRARKRIEIANKIRVMSFIIATFIAAIFYVGMSAFPDSGWFQAVDFPIVCILVVLVVIIVISTFAKLPLIAAHNRIVKQQGKDR